LLDAIVPAETVGTLKGAESAGGINQLPETKSSKERRDRSDLQGPSCYCQSCCQLRDRCKCSTQKEWARDLGYVCKYNFKGTTMFQILQTIETVHLRGVTSVGAAKGAMWKADILLVGSVVVLTMFSGICR